MRTAVQTLALVWNQAIASREGVTTTTPQPVRGHEKAARRRLKGEAYSELKDASGEPRHSAVSRDTAMRTHTKAAATPVTAAWSSYGLALSPDQVFH